jgi:predicted lipoprotein with Yx(FWY)xxD motif
MRVIRLRFWPSLLVCAAALGFGAPLVHGDEALPDGVSVMRSAAGEILLDARGHVLYTYARDTQPNVSTCVAECAKAWPPLSAPAEGSGEAVRPPAQWSAITRPDGSRQWSFRGKPLYTFAKDSTPRVALGDRVGQAWAIAVQPVRTPPGIALRSIHLGRVLVDARGLTLYWHDDEKPRTDGGAPRLQCEGACLRQWTPLAAPLMGQAIGDWKPIDRADGPRQWTFKGRPLYVFAGDIRPGDTAGEGAEKGVWRTAVLEAAAPLPSWVTLQRSDMGEIFADARGFTLYTQGGSLERIRTLLCRDDCIRKNWRLVTAANGAKPSGEWTVVDSPFGDGEKVWAYKGDPLYTHTRDREPGAVGGDKWAAGSGGAGGGWNPILRRRDYER